MDKAAAGTHGRGGHATDLVTLIFQKSGVPKSRVGPPTIQIGRYAVQREQRWHPV